MIGGSPDPDPGPGPDAGRGGSAGHGGTPPDDTGDRGASWLVVPALDPPPAEARDDVIWIGPPPDRHDELPLAADRRHPDRPRDPGAADDLMGEAGAALAVEYAPTTDDPQPPRPPGPARARRGRLIAVGVAAVVVFAGVLALRTDVEPPTPPVTAPDGEVIRAYHDPALVSPPERPEGPPPQPGEIRSDPRHRGATVWWPASPHGYDVRWGPVGQEPTESRVVTGSGTTFTGLAPGRYRVDVRSVDAIGRRSEPRTGEFEALAEPPPWTEGLDFSEDLTVDGAIDLDRWQLPLTYRECVRRAPGGPLLIGDTCFEHVRPTSSVRLGEPDADGVRGRVVVVTDTPAPPRPGLAAPGDELLWAGNLYISVGPDRTGPWMPESVSLGLAADRAHLTTPGDDLGVPTQDVTISNGAGVLHRWELVFTRDEVVVLRNGERVVARPFTTDRDELRLAIAMLGGRDGGSDQIPSTVRVAYVGFTGDAPDGRPTTTTRPFQHGVESPVLAEPMAAQPTAESARLTGLAHRVFDGEPPPSQSPLGIVATLGGVPLDVTLEPLDELGSGGLFGADVPAELVRRGGELRITSADGTPFNAYDVLLEVTHEAGAPVEEPVLGGLQRRQEWMFTRPAVIVRRNGRVVTASDPFQPGVLDVEVRIDAARTYLADDVSAGWVAVRVELDDTPILDVPTATDGSAVLGVYRFTLDMSSPSREHSQLLVRVIPDRPGVTPTTERVTLRSRR